MLHKEWPKHTILAIAVIASWLKTYITYQTGFSISIDNFMQQMILFISPLSLLLFLYGMSLFFKQQKNRNRYLIAVTLITSIVLYVNVAFYRFFSDFITLPVLFRRTTSEIWDRVLPQASTRWISFTSVISSSYWLRSNGCGSRKALRSPGAAIGKPILFFPELSCF